MFYVNPGELRHKITVQYNASDGTTNPDWQPLFSFLHDGQTTHVIYASKKDLRNKIYYEAAEEQSENVVIFTIRYRDGIKPQMRIIDNGDSEHPYEIIADPIDPEDRRCWLQIHSRRISQNGS